MKLTLPFQGALQAMQRPLRATSGGLIVLYSATAYASRLRMRTVREVLLKQIYFTGIQPLPQIMAMALLVGYLFVVLLEKANPIAGEGSTRALIHALVMEFSPLVCGIIVLSRSGSAITSEIAGMKQKGEIRSLYLMGIEPESYVIVPRVFGVAIGVMLLNFYFFLGCSIGGLTLSALFSKTSFERFFGVFAASITWLDLLYPPIKGAITGMGIAAIACYHGLHVSASSTDIPKAVIATITQGTFFVLIAHTVMILVLR